MLPVPWFPGDPSHACDMQKLWSSRRFDDNLWHVFRSRDVLHLHTGILILVCQHSSAACCHGLWHLIHCAAPLQSRQNRSDDPLLMWLQGAKFVHALPTSTQCALLRHGWHELT